MPDNQTVPVVDEAAKKKLGARLYALFEQYKKDRREAERDNRPYSHDSWGRPYDKFLCGEWDDSKHNDPRHGQAKHINSQR